LSEKIKCTHCHLEFSKDVMIEDNGHYFCCNGCQGVFHLLNEEGLESFYEKAGNTRLTPPSGQYEDSSNFDSPAFYERFVKVNNEGFCEVSLVIEGIHCSACVWLNEKALHNMDGVVEANINYTNNKATIVWADDVVKLSKIIDMIRAIGYDAFPYDASLQEAHANKERKEYYLRLSVALFASMNIMWIAIAQYAGYFSGITQDTKTILNIAEWILATPVLFYSGWIFFRGAYYSIKTKVVNMDLLVISGALLTYIYSVYITITQDGEAYFDSVSMIITFVSVGKFLEVLSKKSIADAMDIMGRDIPNEVNIVKGDKVISCLLEEVKVGDTVVVTSGEKILLDGVITKGSGYFDESSLSGESKEIYKKEADSVISGTTSIDADIYFRATKDFKHSTLSNIISLLESAVNKKPKIQQVANRISEYFSATILLISLFSFFGWYFYSYDFRYSFMIAISVVVIACPCALALATPIATLIGISIGAKKGVLFKEAAHLETMAKADVLLLDKTGTLTLGEPKVVKEKIFKEFDKNLLYCMVKSSKHPVACGIRDYLEKDNKDKQEIFFDEFSQIPACGILAKYKNQTILGGNFRLMKNNAIDVKYQSKNTIFYIAVDKEIVAVYELEDMLKHDAKELISQMNAKGIETVMLTGDQKDVANRIAKEVGINRVLFEQTPSDKSDYVEMLHKDGKKVVMVGDGINDILALANADIGIVMGSGSDIAIEVGDIVLLQSSLDSLMNAFKISRTTFILIKQNLLLSLIYNAITIPLAVAGYVIPIVAAVSMSISSLLVVGNSVRIRMKYNRG